MPGAFETPAGCRPLTVTATSLLCPRLRRNVPRPATEHLFAMDWGNPSHRTIMELEGLRRWVAPRLEGYEILFEAVQEQRIGSRW